MAKKGGVDSAAPETALDNTIGSLGQDDLVSLMMPAEEAETDEPAEEAEEEAEESFENTTTEDEEEEQSEPASVLERYNLTDLSEDERIALNKELGGKAAERFGEFTSTINTLKAEVETLRGELGKRSEMEAPVKDNPYANTETMEELNETFTAAVSAIQLLEEALEDNEGADPDDVVYQSEDGSALTKREARAKLRTARQHKDTFIPARANELKKTLGFQQAMDQRMVAVASEHPWLTDDSSELKGLYDSVAPRVISAAKKALPELLPDLPKMMALYIEDVKKVKAKPPAKEVVKRKAPDTHGGTGAPSSRPGVVERKRKNEKVDQFLNSRGSLNDVAKLFMPD